MDKIKRVEVGIPEGIKDLMMEGLTPFHGLQKYTILAALRKFSELPIQERMKRVNDEVHRGRVLKGQ